MRLKWMFTMMMALCLSFSQGIASETEKPGRIDVIEATAEGVVQSIDQENRKVVLKGTNGNLVTIDVAPDVENLDQVELGDVVTIQYFESVAFQVFSPGQVAPGASVIAAGGESVPGEKPAAVAVKETAVVAIIQGIDKESEAVSLQMPDGSLDVVKVRDPENLEKVDTGDKVLIVHTQSIGVKVTEKQSE